MHIKHYVMPVLLALAVGGCQPSPAAPTPTPLSTEMLAQAPVAGCSGAIVFVMSMGKDNALHQIARCSAAGHLTLPGDAGPALDHWVSCDPASGANPLLWSRGGKELMYVTDYYYSGHGEIHILNVADRSTRVLAASYGLVDVLTGETISTGCTAPGECHPAEIRDGQVLFINSRNPRWSPGGGQIAFESMAFDTANGNAPQFHTFLMDWDGTNIRALTDQQSMELSAAWSRDAVPPHNRLPLNYETKVDGLSVGCVEWTP